MSPTHHPGTPRAILDSLAGIAAGPAFLAAGWALDPSISHAALGGNARVMLPAPARLVIELSHPGARDFLASHPNLPRCITVAVARSGPGRSGEQAALTFTSVAEMLACLTSPSGQAFLADLAAHAPGPISARVTTVPAPGITTTEAAPPIAAD